MGLAFTTKSKLIEGAIRSLWSKFEHLQESERTAKEETHQFPKENLIRGSQSGRTLLSRREKVGRKTETKTKRKVKKKTKMKVKKKNKVMHQRADQKYQ